MKSSLKFKKFFNNIQNFFTSDYEWDKQKNKIYFACEKGDFKAFEKYYNIKNSFLSLSSIIHKTCVNGKIDLLKFLLEKNEIHEHVQSKADFSGTFAITLANNQLSVVKYMLSDDFPQKIDMYSNAEEGMREVLKNNHEKTINYLLYDKNYQLTGELRKYLEENGYENQIIHFEKRDLFLSLNDIKNENGTTKKIKSIKI